MSLLADMRTYLLSKAAIAAIVGTDVSVGYADQGAKQVWVTLSVDGGAPPYHHGGESGICETRVEIVSRSVSSVQAHALDSAIKDAISGFRGDWGSTTIGACMVTEPIEIPEARVNASDRAITNLTRIATVQYYRAVPVFS